VQGAGWHEEMGRFVVMGRYELVDDGKTKGWKVRVHLIFDWPEGEVMERTAQASCVHPEQFMFQGKWKEKVRTGEQAMSSQSLQSQATGGGRSGDVTLMFKEVDEANEYFDRAM
jgi:hypothetical protein